MNETNLAKGVGTLGRDNLRPMAFGGHALYCRKCLRGDAVGEHGDRAIGGIVLPQVVYGESTVTKDGQVVARGQTMGSPLEETSFVEVLAKGPRVGKPCTEEHAEKFHRDICLSDDVEIGDIVACPRESIGILRSPVADFEFFIEESVPLYTVEEPDEQPASPE